MNNRATMFVQAARGPLLLITVGVLFALQQADLVSLGRTWPLLIIVIGVMKLLERMLGPRVPVPVGPPYASPGAPSYSNVPPYRPPHAPYPGQAAPPSSGDPAAGGPAR